MVIGLQALQDALLRLPVHSPTDHARQSKTCQQHGVGFGNGGGSICRASVRLSIAAKGIPPASIDLRDAKNNDMNNF